MNFTLALARTQASMIFRLLSALTVAAAFAGPASAAFIATFDQLSPTPTSYVQNIDFRVFAGIPDDSFVATGSALGTLQSADDGCTAGDFFGFTAGNIALIERGTCVFSDKVNLAEAAGAIGAVIYNNQSGLISVGFVADTDIPALFITQALGTDFLAATRQGGVRVQINITAVPEPATLALVLVGLITALLARKSGFLTARIECCASPSRG